MIGRLILLVAVGVISIWIGGFIGGILAGLVCTSSLCTDSVIILSSLGVAVVMLSVVSR